MGSYTVLLAKLISKELLALRRRLSLTQEAMAEYLHISCRAYGDLERGKYAISAATLMFLFRCLPQMCSRGFSNNSLPLSSLLKNPLNKLFIPKFLLCVERPMRQNESFRFQRIFHVEF